MSPVAQLLLRPTEETVKNAFYGRPLVGVSPHPPPHPPPVYFHTLTLHVGNARRRTYSRSYADRAADRLFSLQFVRVFMAGHLFAGRNIWGT